MSWSVPQISPAAGRLFRSGSTLTLFALTSTGIKSSPAFAPRNPSLRTLSHNNIATQAMLSIFVGVVSAGMIMSCLTLAGKAGALLATAVLAVFCVSNILSGGKGSANASDS